MIINTFDNLVCVPGQVPTVKQAITEFEKDYFTRRSRNSKSMSTWDADYGYVFKRLPPNQLLTTDLILETVQLTEPDSRNRVRFCMVLTALAKFAGVEIDLKPYRGKHSLIKTAPRKLPSDKTIEDLFCTIKPSDWKWAYGIMAAYGLRNHEVFHIDTDRLASGNKCLLIQDGKTGERIVYPFRPEWFERFELSDVRVPSCTASCNRDLGNRVCHAFKRFNLPFTAYDLRHAWAVRSMAYGLNISLAAQQMGHSVDIHSKVYHRWINERVHQSAYEAILNRLTG